MNRPLEIFEMAMELRDAERAACLDRACGDDVTLRAEVDSLLAAHAAAGGFLDDPTYEVDATLDLSRDVVDTASTPGRVIGRYRLLEQIGEGGFGTVWMAEQREPIKRRVALKIIKPGMDTGQVIARFEAERQALAMMDHPNIAKVLDGGSTDTGHPFFVMEYIRGVSIIQYCDTEKLDTPARLELFAQACAAIQHAHQKGIIHRDIKPSNVMITLNDGTPVVKVIDFGIAKATSAELTTRTLFTRHHQILGTPAYMSPEQAEMSGLDIDTRTDVYALGVLLYEMLTGTTPFDTEALAQAGFAEMMRIIREDEPHKPSTRLSSLGDGATRTAQQRRTDIGKLGMVLRGDLDWIVMKCLEKDRARRYETANGLATDIRRHLADQPVTAGPPSATYRLGKFIKRHRAGVVAATIVATAVMLGAAGLAVGVMRARSAEAFARALQPQADEYSARVLLDQADELWPPHPDPLMMAALEQWTITARELTRSLPDHRARLAEVRTRAVPRTPQDAAGMGDDERAPTWSFESPVDQSTHDLLMKLVAELELLSDDDGLLAADAVAPGHGWSVPKRRAFAEMLAAASTDGGQYAAAWADARRAIPLVRADLNADGIEDEAPYEGLDLIPQVGLAPLGPDPVSKLWEFAHLLSGTPAERDADNGTLVLTKDTGLVLVLIPGGTFLMGPDRAPATKHAVTLSPYFVSKYEMTQGQWKRLTGQNPSAYGPGPDAEWKPHWLASGDPPSYLHPVEQLTWTDCDPWLRRAGLSLPSEAQWERAARAGTQTRLSTGPEPSSLEGAANLRDAYFAGAGFEDWGRHVMKLNDGSVVHWAVGRHRPNRFGLHEVHGNVWEWCLDAYAPYPESASGPVVDPVVQVSTDAKYVSRGGSFRTGIVGSGHREFWPAEFYASGLGVRPARAITGVTP